MEHAKRAEEEWNSVEEMDISLQNPDINYLIEAGCTGWLLSWQTSAHRYFQGWFLANSQPTESLSSTPLLCGSPSSSLVRKVRLSELIDWLRITQEMPLDSEDLIQASQILAGYSNHCTTLDQCSPVLICLHLCSPTTD